MVLQADPSNLELLNFNKSLFTPESELMGLVSEPIQFCTYRKKIRV